jgi:hypothetical protein
MIKHLLGAFAVYHILIIVKKYFMKTLLVILFCLGIGYGASAQHSHTVVVGAYHGPVYVYRPPLFVSAYSPFYPSFGFYGIPFGGVPFPGYYPYPGAYNSSSKLQKKEDDIRSDYADRIYSVKQDESLTHKEKRQAIHSLKKQRNQEIHDLVANYHKQPATQGNGKNSNTD